MDGSRIAFVIRSLPKTPLITAWMTETTTRSTMIALVRAHRLAVSMELGGAFQETALLTLGYSIRSRSAPIDKKGNELLRCGQRPVMTVQSGLRRVDVPLHDPNSTIGSGDSVADPLPRPVRNPRPEDPGGDRLLPLPDPHPVAEDRPPGADHVRSRTRHGADIPGSSFARKQPDTAGQLRMIRQVEPLIGSKIHH